MRALAKAAVENVAERLAPLGFTKSRAGVFVMPMNRQVLGWVGLNKAVDQSDNSVVIAPIVGVRHQEVERSLANLLGEKYDESIPPTIAVNLGYLTPKARYEEFSFYSELTVASTAAELVEALQNHGLPFFRGNAALPMLLETLCSGEFGIEHQSVFRIPIVLRQLGREDEAVAAIEDETRSIQGRNDTVADRFRRFAHAFVGRVAR